MALTQHTAGNAETRDKPYEIPDNAGNNAVRGLLLRILPTGRRLYYVTIKRGHREKLGDASHLTLSEARVEAKKILGDAAKGVDFKAARVRKRAEKQQTLVAYLDGEFSVYAKANIASHADFIRSIRKGFEDVLDKPMTDINELDMAKWRKKRAGVTLATQRRELTYLKALLNRAVRDKVITGHQLGHYRVKANLDDNQNASKVRFLSDAEEKRLRKALTDRDKKIKAKRASANAWRSARGYDLKPNITGYADHIEPLVLLALNTGLRRGDLFNLRWDNVDLIQKQITLVIGKTSHSRRKAGKSIPQVNLPLSTEAVRVLSKWQKQVYSDLVFPSPQGGKLDNIKNGWDTVIKDAAIENFRFHDLRHTFASRLVQAGVDINTVRELMTHSDIKMTLVYAHLSPDHKAAALERAFGGQS